MTDTVSGGTWTSSATSVATVSSTGVVTGVSAGSTTITYTVTTGCGTAIATHALTINPLPSAGAISGPTSICAGATTTLTDTVSGGTWTSGATSVATVSGAGVVYGVSAGSTTITYTVTTGCGTATATHTVTVNPIPSAGATSGATSVCAGATSTLTDTVSGGTWTSGATSVATVSSAGVITGVSAGSTTITYTVTTGCGTATATHTVTVTPLPTASSITGATSLCAGATTTLTDTVSGGTWTSSTTSVATVSSTGVVTGVAAGSTTITYTVTTGCGTATATHSVTVSTVPVAPSAITGVDSVCSGSVTTFTDATSGGSWSSGTTAIATVGATGTVYGVSTGSAAISYTVTNGCGATSVTRTLTVHATPNAGIITGSSLACLGATTTLTDTATGGTWSSSATYAATVSTSGVVTGVAGGIAVIFYTVTNSCGTATATDSIVIDAPVVTAASFHNCGEITGLYATGISGGSYVWSGTGVSCTGCDTTYANPSATTTYTVTGTDAHGCPAHNTVSVNGNRIMGHISFSGPTPDTLDTKVWLIQFNPSDSSLVALDSTVTCLDGGSPYYEFDGIASGNYLVKAKLIYGTIPGSSGYIPTYSYASQYWDSAATAMHSSGSDSLHVNMIYGTVPTGSGFISGYVFAGAGRGTSGEVPVNGMIVYLRNATTSVLTYTYTDATGYYSFSHLADGEYDIFPADYDYYTTPSAVITLTASAETINNIDFKQHTTLGTITPFNSLATPLISSANSLSVFPNPTTGSLNIQWAGQQNGEAVIRLTDVTGKEVYKSTWDIKTPSGTLPVNVNNLVSGVYFINISTATGTYTQKIVADMK